MQQKDLTKVIDEWTAAMAEFIPYAPPDVREHLTERLKQSTSDLLESFASTATELASGTAVAVLKKLEVLTADVESENDRIGAIERRQMRHREIGDDMQHQIDQHSDRLGALEDRQLDTKEAGG